MKSLLILALSLVSLSASAHVELGIYAGKTADGVACSMECVKEYMEDGMPHPLNERFLMKVDGETYAVGHPAVLDRDTGKIAFNHDILQSVIADPTGAHALMIDMLHTPGNDGPVSFSVIKNDWKAKTTESVKCLNLVHQE